MMEKDAPIAPMTMGVKEPGALEILAVALRESLRRAGAHAVGTRSAPDSVVRT